MTTLILTLSLLVPAAPAPRPRPALQVVAGCYDLSWDGIPFHVHLGRDGYYSCGGLKEPHIWEGRWEWDRTTRILTIHEYVKGRVPRDECKPWMVQLDGKLRGKGGYGITCYIPVVLRSKP